MKCALLTIFCIFLAFNALCLACAVVTALRRGAGVGLFARHKRPDPFAQPFGDMPGFSQEQLDRLTAQTREQIQRDPLRRSFAHEPLNSAGLALRPDADGGRPIPSWSAAIANFIRGEKLFRGARHGD